MRYFYEMQPKLIKCDISDVQQLANLSLETFSDAFGTQNDPDDFEAYLTSAFNSEKLLSELENPNSSFYFVLLGEAIVGYLKINFDDAQSDIHDPNSLELERIYILNSHQGKNLGSWALEQTFQLAKKSKKQYIWLGVWERNQKAIKFYERFGFKKFGEHAFFIGSDRQIDWLMRCDL